MDVLRRHRIPILGAACPRALLKQHRSDGEPRLPGSSRLRSGAQIAPGGEAFQSSILSVFDRMSWRGGQFITIAYEKQDCPSVGIGNVCPCHRLILRGAYFTA